MSVLQEVKNCRQVPGELSRRWFSADNLDLIVWCQNDGAPVGFQFCYEERWTEHALTWRRETGYHHATVDDGESNPGLQYKGTPVLMANGPINFPFLQKLFAKTGIGLPADIAAFVAERLIEPAQLPKI